MSIETIGAFFSVNFDPCFWQVFKCKEFDHKIPKYKNPSLGIKEAYVDSSSRSCVLDPAPSFFSACRLY